ncbi:glycoside hydrolase family 99-like domain-containing protein [Candidatus Saccharibacteria bacterium]|nr:glycoside hydrolase family 99-like domain-containing protein [Candidatus Saccharibacteria bacterium]
MKIIAFYLPQFHEVEFNNKHHGKGFTEWTSLGRTKSLYENHNQPRVPLDNNYYNLEDDKVKAWQIKMAKRAGLYGFCMYHYWSDGNLLLERPVEQWLKNKKLDFPFCLSWANHPWSQHLTGGNRKLIRAQKYGDEEEWTRHCDYLMPFFKDERYIKEDNRPLFIIYKPQDIPNLNKRLEFYDKKAKENGLAGINFIFQDPFFANSKSSDLSHFKYGIEFQPAFAIQNMRGKLDLFIRKVGGYVINKVMGLLKKQLTIGAKKLEILSYNDIWHKILTHKPANNKMLPGAFNDWDNTPRNKEWGLSLSNVSVKSFQEYMEKLIVRTKKVYKKDIIFFTAWNEWAEGCYLEPDTKYKYEWLDAINDALESTNERPY